MKSFFITIVAVFMALFSFGNKEANVVSQQLINLNATENTKAVYEFLKDNYGKNVISGQYINTFDDYSQEKFLLDKNDPTSWNVFKAYELQAINSVTEDYPLILGLDMCLVLLGTDQYTVDFAQQWHEKGGIVTMCWHWVAPNREGEKRSFYSKDTDFDLSKALADKSSDDYKAIIADIDIVSEALAVLNEADVPVLWRPLHEASGGWFWWGASGADAYKELYDIMYDRMVNYHGLNNLIWMANAQDKNWYVGDDKCDILSDDPYYPKSSKLFYKIDPTNAVRFNKNLLTSKNKIIAMSENEFLPDVDKMFKKGVYWSMFATWSRDYVCIADEAGYPTPEYNEKYVTKDELNKVYKNDKVLTLSKAGLK